MDFQEFCAAAISASQYEGLERWEYQTHTAYEIFEREGNRVVMIEDLAKVRVQKLPKLFCIVVKNKTDMKVEMFKQDSYQL